MAVHPFLTVYKKELAQYINTDYEVEALDNACSFSEGPVWNPDGDYLFSDIPLNAIFKIGPEQLKNQVIAYSGFTGSDQSFLSEQIGSNGLTYDNDGSLLVCQHGNGAVAKFDGKELKPFITSYQGQRFNSPNDIVVDKNGTVFFTDPPYGLKDQKLVPQLCQPVAGLYGWRNGDIVLIEDDLLYPNGVCLSPDHRILYCCSNKPQEKHVLAYDAETLLFKKVATAENADGIKCDPYGNLYLCSKEGILIIDELGERLGKIELPAVPANACWGGVDGTDLLITARQYIFLISGLLKKP